MKKIFTLFCLLALFGANNLFAQQWMQSIKSSNPNFFEIQKAFNDYQIAHTSEVKGGDEVEDASYEKFKRWEWYWEQRVGKGGQFPSPSLIWDESKNYQNSHPQHQPRGLTTGTWTFMGPSTTSGGYVGIGRVNCIAFHPTVANTFWVGTPAGGLWKTTDGGVTWITNTDNLPVLGVSDIAIDPTNPNGMYIATGDGDFGSLSACTGSPPGDTKSIGILKSTDGGTTWNTTGMNWSVTSTKLIRRLIINPNNPQILLAAASDGIWKTINGGSSWTNVQSGYFMDLEFMPGSPTIVYASTYSFTGAQIYRSTNSGASWTQVSNLTGILRINLEVTANSPSLVSALCCTTQGGFGGLLYSNNSGATFSPYSLTVNCSNDILSNMYPISGCGDQGYYDLAHAINPSNYQEIWAGGVNSWKTTDAGATWNLNNYWIGSNGNPGVPTVHADKHFIAYHPLNNSFVYECNDGGLYETNNGGTNWYNLSNGLEISQIYRIGTSATIINNVVSGLQDNGTKELYNNNWIDRLGGDGMECIIDYTNANTEYVSRYNGQIYRTLDAFASDTTLISNNIPGMTSFITTYGHGPGAWVTPYVIDPSNPQILYAGYHNIWKTTDQGNTWAQISNLGLANNPNGIDHPLRSLVVAPSNPQTIYTASFDTLFFTYDGGTNWYYVPVANITGNNSDNISYITVKANNPQTLWLTISGYDLGKKVFTSTNGGVSWTNISGTLPNLPVNCIVYENGSANGLYIGTDVGVYYRDSTMSDWIYFNNGLPNVVVTELEISYNNNKLWAATFGRGLWQSDLYVPTPPIASFSSNTTSICSGNCINFTDNSTNSPTSWQWSFPNGNPPSSISQNPTVCYNAGGTYNVSLTVSNLDGSDHVILNSYVNVNSSVTPALSISPNSTQAICSGQTVSFTATPTNGGSGPTYQWYVNGNPAGSGATFTTTSLTNNATVYCQMTSTANCANPTSVNSSTTSIVVSNSVIPSVSISPSVTQSICTGQTVSFTTTPTNGGSNPSYQWYLNGSLSGTGATFTTSPLNSNATVYCQMTSNSSCANPTTANSPTISVIVSSSFVPSVSISSTTATTVCSGQTVSFTANPTNGGSNPLYQWYENSNPVGNGATFTTSPLSANAIVYCQMTSNSSCANPTTANSNSIAITVNPNPTANAGNDVTITQGNSANLTASGGTTYAWSNGASTDSVTVSPNTTTTYTVTVTDANGCTASDIVIVNVQQSCSSVYTLSASSTTVPASGGNCSVNLTTDSSCTWIVNDGGCIAWVIVNTPSGTGASTISFSVDTNILPSQRTCFATIEGNLFSIIQAPATTTGIQDISALKNISIFPNPNTGTFTLSIDCEGNQKLKVNLLNSLGQVVAKQEIQTHPGVSKTDFDLSSNAKGIYHMMIFSKEKFYYLKVLVE